MKLLYRTALLTLLLSVSACASGASLSAIRLDRAQAEALRVAYVEYESGDDKLADYFVFIEPGKEETRVSFLPVRKGLEMPSVGAEESGIGITYVISTHSLKVIRKIYNR